MKNRMIKVGTVVPRMKVANVTYNVAQIIQTMNENADAGFLVYPELCLTGYTKNPASAFSFIVWMICATLYVTFATFILGTTVPTFIILFFMIILAEKVTT